MSTVTRPSGVRQAGFDQIPVAIQQADLLGNAKRLYGVLMSMQRMGREPTYAELAVELHASTRSIIRWVARLAEAGLIAVRRRGQGLSNLIRVLGLVTSRSDSRPRPAVPDRHVSPRIPPKEKKMPVTSHRHPFYSQQALHYPGGG